MNLVILLALLRAGLEPSLPNAPIVANVMERWAWVGLEVTVVTARCGMQNAAYFPEDRVIVLCKELDRSPGLTGWVLSHELGHAFMWQNEVPQREGTFDQERVADEMAFLFSDDEENLAAQRWFISMGPRKEDSSDPHPSPRRRAAALICLDAGRHQESDTCEAMYDSVLAHWIRIFDGYWPGA